MNRLRLVLVSLAVAAALPGEVSAQGTHVTERIVRPARVQVDAIGVGPLIVMLLRDVMRVPYVISPEVLGDGRQVSVDLVFPRAEIPRRVVNYIRSLGYEVNLEGGAVIVGEPGAAAPRPVSGVASMQPATVDRRSFGPVEQLPPPVPSHLVAFPAFRSVSELGEVLETVIPEIDVASREESAPRDGKIAGALHPNALVLAGTTEQMERARQLLQVLDVPVPLVEIEAAILEVRTGENNGSALTVIADLFGGNVQFGANSAALPGDNYLRLALGGLSAVFSASDGDGRFRVLARPRLSARSGSVATLNSGAEVPTVGQVSYAEDGTPIRSVVYRESGISLELEPLVRGDLIELGVRQERSNFERTTTGVNDSPTLNRAASSSTVVLQPGEVLALAGLTQETEETRRDGLLGGLFSAKSDNRTDSELVVVIQARIVQVPTDAAIRFVQFDAPQGDRPTQGVGVPTPANSQETFANAFDVPNGSPLTPPTSLPPPRRPN